MEHCVSYTAMFEGADPTYTVRWSSYCSTKKRKYVDVCKVCTLNKVSIRNSLRCRVDSWQKGEGRGRLRSLITLQNRLRNDTESFSTSWKNHNSGRRRRILSQHCGDSVCPFPQNLQRILPFRFSGTLFSLGGGGDSGRKHSAATCIKFQIYKTESLSHVWSPDLSSKNG